MKAQRKLGLAGLVLAGMSLVGCPFPNGETPTPSPTPHRSWADITFEVTGTNEINQANNITYGRLKSNGDWDTGYPFTTGPVSLPWTLDYGTDCTGHSLRLSVSSCGQEGDLTLKIKDDGKVGKQQTWNGDCFVIFSKIDYYIPSQ